MARDTSGAPSAKVNAGGNVAVIGMACVFPGAKNVEQYWHNILSKEDCTSDPPPDWETEFFYDQDSNANDRTYCKRGGFLGSLADFDPTRYGVMPNSVDGAEPDHFLSLRAAYDALADAGYTDVGRFRERTEVIIGRGTYVNRGNANALQHAVMVDSVIRVLRQLHPEHTEQELENIKLNLKSTLPPFHADTAAGLVPNIISGRICNRLDLMGTNYIVDAACASSLVAVDLAVRDLQTNRCDMALAGGVNASVSPVIMIIFSQLKALSRKGLIRPFASEADGTLLAEGVGMLVLKRLEDAELDGDRIYAVIKGVGCASDGRANGLLAPRIEGEELALRRAYEAAAVDPSTVGMIEAHGTATAIGDAVEVKALTSVFGARKGEMPGCALGSVKSMIGHTMPASGAAGLINVVLALHHKVLPPTLLSGPVNPKLEIEKSNFYINTEARPWIHGSSRHPRRAGVNAFGFGGINAHAVVEEYTGSHKAASVQHTWDSELFVVSAENFNHLAAAAQSAVRLVSGLDNQVTFKDLAWHMNCSQEMGPARLTLVARNRDDLLAKLERAITRLLDARTLRIRDAEGIYCFSEPLAKTGKLAVIFPGEGAQYTNMLADICMHFPEAREWFDLMDEAFEDHPRGYKLSDTVFPPPGLMDEKLLWSMDIGAEAVFCANQAMYAVLNKLGIQPDVMLGHSTGEHSSLLASGIVKTETRAAMIRHILSVNRVFSELSEQNRIAQGCLMTVAGVGKRELDTLIASHPESLFVALDNCPHQVVLFGSEASIESVTTALSGKAAICQKLPFGRAYHTPWFDVFARSLERYFESITINKPSLPLYSCVTASLYPEDVPAIRKLAADQWASSVRFRETIEGMYRDGVRIFVEAGPKNNLTSFVDDTLRGKSYLAVASNVPHRSGISQLNHLLAQLVAHQVPVRLEHLYAHRKPRSIFDNIAPGKCQTVLSMGLQPLRLPLDFPSAKPAIKSVPLPVQVPVHVNVVQVPPVPHPRTTVVAQHMQTMEHFLALQQQVMTTFLTASRNGPARIAKTNGHRPNPPLITEILEIVNGVRARAKHPFRLDREILFKDHTLGRDVSMDDPSLSALAVVPMTVTMEILAEGGALLKPGKVLAGMLDVRASKWITLEKAALGIEIQAQQLEDESAVRVTIRAAGEEGIRPVWAEGTMLFADNYPPAPAPSAFHLNDEQQSAWLPWQLYSEGMFHGPSFQGVRSVDRSGTNGVVATIEVLPRGELIAGLPEPDFRIDPVVLDAAGQVVAFWSQEKLEPCGDIFPYRLSSLRCYQPLQPAGTVLKCRVSATHISATDIHSDIEIVDTAGRLHYRFESWQDRRFHLPLSLWQSRIAPRSAYLSEPLDNAIPLSVDRNDVACCRISGFRNVFEASHGIWMNVLAHLILSRRERQEWLSMQQPPVVEKRRQEWLLGRCAAKDAVRMLIKMRYKVDLCPADVEIMPDALGQPMAQGAWTARLNANPVVSLAHSSGTAVAFASLDPGWLIGIDLESLVPAVDRFEGLAFVDEERLMLSSLPDDSKPEWFTRLWCAKESVAKALGQGLNHGLRSLQTTSAKTGTGLIEVRVQDGLLQKFPELRGQTIAAHTSKHQDFICSLVYHPKQRTEI